MKRLKLNLGCGDHTPAGWINVDYAVGARLAQLPLFGLLNSRLRLFNLDWDKGILAHNLTKPFPWSDDSVDAIYSSHTLEHMTREQGRTFLEECYRVLKPGGIIRIVVPDLEQIVKKYSDGELPADRFVDALGVSFSDPKDGPLKRRLAFLIRYPHKCMYDSKSLSNAMKEAGFDSRPRKKLDSDIEDIDKVELRDLMDGSIIIEGKKPGGN
jgi:SAM-dependent methyltransferase